MASYKYIEKRGQVWCFIGRRASVVETIEGMRAREENYEEVAEYLHLPMDAIIEADQFIQDNPEECKKYTAYLTTLMKEIYEE